MSRARFVIVRNTVVVVLAILSGSILQPTTLIGEWLGASGAPASPGPTASPVAAASPTASPAGPTTTPTDSCPMFPDAPSMEADQAAAIEAFLIDHRGETVCFEPGATYRVDQTITLRDWSGTILGAGSNWVRSSTDAGDKEHVRLVEGSGIVFDGVNIVGAATVGDIQGRVFGDGDREDNHAFALESAIDVTIRNGSATNTWGDGVYIRSWSETPDVPSRNVVLEDLVFDVTGRNAISVISVEGLVVSGVRSSNVSLHGFDVEPNRTTDIVTNVRVEDSDWRTFDAADGAAGPGFAIVITPGYADVQVSEIAIVGNTMDRASIRIEGFSVDAPASNVTVTGNRADVAGDATFKHIRGFTFTDNGSIAAVLDDVE